MGVGSSMELVPTAGLVWIFEMATAVGGGKAPTVDVTDVSDDE